MITIQAPLAAHFDRDLASSGIVLEFRSYNMVTTAIQNSAAQLAVHAAFSNITDVFFCFSHDFVALNGAGAGDTDVPFFAGEQRAQTPRRGGGGT